jgi:integrase
VTAQGQRQREMLLAFQAWGTNQRNWRGQTIRGYVGVARRADTYIKAQGLAPSLIRANPEDFRAFLWSTPSTTASRALTCKGLRAFGEFLVDTGRRRTNPADNLPRIRIPQGVPKALTAEQAAAVIRASRHAGTIWHTFVLVLFYTGLRHSELRTLRWADVEGRWLRVDGKGGKVRTVPLHPRAWAALRRLEAEGISSAYVFPSPHRWDRPISESAVNNRLKRFGEDAGIERMHAHLGRHTFATLLLEQTSDLRLVQDVLGHASAQTTQVYTRVRPERMREAVVALTI